MKKLYLIFVCVFYTICAQAFKEGALYYNITSTRDMTVEVTYGSEQYDASTYFIPEYVVHDDKRYYVDRIGNSAFSGDNYLTSITIPSNIKSVGDYAFSGCFSLSSVIIDESTATLSLGSGARNGSSLFADAHLTYFFWGRPLSYSTNSGYSPIANQAGLSNITIGSNVTTITPYMFYGNLAISSITLPTTVTSLADHAFHGFMGLKSFTIPEHITSVGQYAFAECTGLTSFTIPGHITSVGQYAFSDCYGLTSVTISEGVTTIEKGTFKGCNNLSSISIPSNVTSIDESAFQNCTGFTNFVFGSGVKSVGYKAFNGCTGLTSFTIPGHVTSIGNRAFDGCTGLKTLKFEPGTETLSLGIIGYYEDGRSDSRNRGLFNDCPLESVELNRTLSYSAGSNYGYSPFANIKTINNIVLRDGTSRANNYLCYGNQGIKTIEFSETVKEIGNYAFCGCDSITSLSLPNSLETIGDGTFSGCKQLTSVVFHPSVKSIGNYTFNGCTSLTGVVFEEGEETLTLGYNNYHNNSSAPEGKGMFFDCPLISTFIGRNLSYNTGSDYGNSPFAKNESLTKVHFGNPVKSIPAYLLKGCNSLTTLEYNSKCAPTTVGSYAFSGCKLLTWDDISLPLSIETIEDGAFKDCENIRSVVIKPAVKSIGNYVFNGCTKITGVVFEECEETLSLGYNNYHNNSSAPEGRGLFFDCPLISTFIGRNLSYNTGSNYGTSPFAHFSTLTSALIGNPVTRIPDYIFQGDAELNKVEFNRNCQLQSVGKYAFEGCTNLTTPQLPSSVTAIEEGAFNGCANFMEFEMPENLATIGSYAFQGCTGLAELNIPATTTSIGNYAFSGCSGIKQVAFADAEATLSLGYGASQGKGFGLFNDCPLEELYIGRTIGYDVNSNGSTGYSPFYRQEGLDKITVGPQVKELPYCIFWGSAIDELYVPSSVRTVHSSFVNSCPNLKKVIILGATPPSVDNYNTLLSGTAEASKFYVFFPDKFKSAKNWSNYADKIDACCEIYSDLIYSGEGHVIGYKTDFPIVLENRETETAEAGAYKKRIDVTYNSNGYSLKDVLEFDYTIQKAPLIITVKPWTRDYGEENPEFTFEYEGFVNGENEHVFTKEPTATTKATVNSAVGEYDITVSSAEAKNYEISYVKGTLTIAKAPLTISAKSYNIRQGDALPVYELEYNGFKNNETKNVLSKRATVNCEASSASLPGEYAITVSGAEATNYEISYENGTLTIAPYSKGDVNNDGYIDVADLTGVVHFILNESTEGLVFESADLDESGAVEINDYAALVKLILNGRYNSKAMYRKSPASLEDLVGLTLGNNGEIFVNLLEDRQFTGMQFDLMLPDGVTLAENGVESESPQHGCWSVHREDGRYSILCSSMTNAELHEGVVIRLKTDGYTEGVVTVSNVVLSDKHAHRHEAAPVQAFMDCATAISKATNNKLIVKTENGMLSLLSDKDQTVIIYGVNGVLAAKVGLSAGQKETVKLPTGVYVVNNKKIVIR